MSSRQYSSDRRDTKFLNFAAVAAKGDLNAVKRHCAQHGRCAHLSSDLVNLAVDMISVPGVFQKPREVLTVLEDNHVNFDNVFTTYLLAEALRGKFMAAPDYRFDINDLVTGVPEQGKNTLGIEFGITAARNSILVMQNMLAEYVRENTDKMPINRGAAMLQLLTCDVSADVSALWTQRMADIVTTTKYSVSMGDITVAKPVYKPLRP